MSLRGHPYRSVPLVANPRTDDEDARALAVARCILVSICAARAVVGLGHGVVDREMLLAIAVGAVTIVGMVGAR